jgi:hypothetical protein
MTARLGRRTVGDTLAASASWTVAELGTVGIEHMRPFAASNHDEPAMGAGGLLATPRAGRRDTAQALVLLLGTLGALLALALMVGSPLAGI